MNAPRLTLSVDNDTPLRLADAIKIAFPRGGITVSGLRKEAAKGRLIIERIAGKDFVTLAAINAMRAECRIGDPKRSRPLQSARQSSRPRLVAFEREAADRRYVRAQTGVLSQSDPEAVPKPRLRLRIFR